MGAGYYRSPWPAEDAGPERLQEPLSGAALRLAPGEHLRCVSRHTLLSTMTVLGDPGEVYLLTHSALRAHLGLPTTACVERIDPQTLKTQVRSPRLKGGPMWPGGMAIHRNGDLYVVYGRHAHRLNRDCQPVQTTELPQAQPYNSFVILDNGLLVTKNLSDMAPAMLSVLDPNTLQPVCEPFVCPEPSVARLSASGHTVYVAGVHSLMRLHWDAHLGRLVLDEGWRFDYTQGNAQSYGWDVVLDGDNAWFMDNGRHRYVYTMRGAGQTPTPNRLLRVSLRDANDHSALEVSGLARGSVTNPPLFDRTRQIVVGYDSANACLAAWRWVPGQGGLHELWRKSPFGCASHMLLYPDSGELIVNDYRRFGEEVVVLDIETGNERGRVSVGGLTQGVVFPSAGWGRDLYWSSMGKLARIFVAQDTDR